MPGMKRGRDRMSSKSKPIGETVGDEEAALVSDLFGSDSTSTELKQQSKRRKTQTDATWDTIEGEKSAQSGGDGGNDAWIDEATAGESGADAGSSEIDISRSGRTRKLRQSESETKISKQEYEARLREFHTKSIGGSDWARLAAGEDSEDTAGAWAEDGARDVRGSATSLAPLPERSTAGGVVDVATPGAGDVSRLRATRLKDANSTDYHRSVVSSVAFHGSGRLLLSAGLDCSLKFFKVEGGSSCEKAHAVTVPGFPVSTAAFSRGERVLAFGRRPFFYSYDVPSGRSTRVSLHGRHERSWERAAVNPGEGGPFAAALLGDAGSVLLLDGRTHRVVQELKVDGDAWCAAFDREGTQLAVGSSSGQLSLFDARASRPLLRRRHRDEGSAGVTCIGCAGGQYAAGAASGVVNFYSAPAVGAEGGSASVAAEGGGGGFFGGGSASPSSSSSSSFFAGRSADAATAPSYTSMNLRTRLQGIAFSRGAGMAAVWSREQKDQLRVVDTRSRAVYANWPTSKTPLSHVQCAAFAPDDGMLAIGNDKGRVLLYALG